MCLSTEDGKQNGPATGENALGHSRVGAGTPTAHEPGSVESVEEATHVRPHSTRFYCCEPSRTGRATEMASRSVAAGTEMVLRSQLVNLHPHVTAGIRITLGV